MTVFLNPFCSGTCIFRPHILCQISDSYFAFNIVVQYFPYIQVIRRFIIDCDVSPAVRCQDPAVARAGNAAGQINPASFCINVFQYQLLILRVVIHLRHVFKGADGMIKYRLAAIVHLIHGTALNSHFIRLSHEAVNILDISDFRFVFAVAALDEAVHVNIRCRDIHAVAGDASKFRIGDVCSRLLQSFCLRL